MGAWLFSIERWKWPWRLLAALGLLALATLAALGILYPGPHTHTHTPFAPFYLAVVASFYLCGNGAGILVTALSALLVEILFLYPSHGNQLPPEDVLSLAFFGLTCGLIGMMISRLRTISESQKTLIGRLIDSDQHFQALMKATPVGVFETDDRGYCIAVNEAWKEITGCHTFKASGSGWVHALHPEDRDAVVEAWQSAVDQGMPFCMEYRFLRPGQQTVWVIGQAEKMVSPGGRIKGYVGTITNITERKEIEASLVHHAQTDFLTGTHNRRHFLDLAQSSLATALERGETLALFIIDIDNFKQINDTYGHDAGDFILRRMGEVCRSYLHGKGFIGRIGGEEFAVVMPGFGPGAGIEAAEELRRSLMQAELPRIEPATCPENFTVSIGVTFLAAPTDTLSKMMKRADEALYQAKSDGRNRVCRDEPVPA